MPNQPKRRLPETPRSTGIDNFSRKQGKDNVASLMARFFRIETDRLTRPFGYANPKCGSVSVAVVLDTVMLDSTDLDTLDRATQAFSQVLGSLDTDVLALPTACGDWTVNDVANHVCGGALRYAHYLRGGMPDEIAWTRTADNVGNDPRTAHDNLSAELRTLFAQSGAGSIRAHHPMQTVSGAVLLRMRVAELTVHAWDIASTLDATSTIDNDLAAYILDRAASILQAQREHGYFADVEPANPNAPAPARLLALTGRSMP
jgi:uncharacterized protein (TIGR03086 family)